MLPKQIAYILYAIIALLAGLFAYSVYTNYQKKIDDESYINNLITKFEDKHKADSIYLVKSNKLIIDKISQKILDSVSNAYEKELKIALSKAQAYKNILIENNISIPGETTATTEEKTTTNSLNKSKSVVISYKQLPNFNPITQKFKTNPTTTNVTTHNRLHKIVNNNTNSQHKLQKQKTSNVTTYSKLKSKTEKRNINNVTSYSKLTKSTIKTNSKPKRNNSNTKIISQHNNPLLDNAENISNLETPPIYPSCENNYSRKEQQNCFAINIHKNVLGNFNTQNIQNIGLERGLNKLRVLFIIDRNGNTRMAKLVGNWPRQVFNEVKKAVESTPRIKPGIKNNQPVAVKYSLLISFIIN